MPAARLLLNPELSKFRLPPDVLALFAAGAGVLVINATAEEFGAAHQNAQDQEAFALWSVINHETYHLLQTVCTGYCFDWAQKIKQVTLRHVQKAVWRDFRADIGANVLLICCRALPDGLRRRFEIERIENVAQRLIDHNTLIRLAQAKNAGDHSLAGTDLPGLFADLELIRRELHAAGPSRLSAFHVIEGAAAVAQLTLEARALGNADLDPWILKEFSRFGEGYRDAYLEARGECGSRASALFLPAAALALRYQRPGEALLPICRILARAQPGEEVGAARNLAASMPALPPAGRLLGTAAAVWRRRGWKFWKKPHCYYEPQMNYLAASGQDIDEIGALAELQRFDQMPASILSSVVRLSDQLGGIGVTQLDALLRVNFAGIQLRFMGRARWELDVQQDMSDWAQQVVRRLVDSAPEPIADRQTHAPNGGRLPE